MKPTVVIVSEYASANLGDQAISRSLEDILSPRFEVKFLSFGGLVRPAFGLNAASKSHGISALRGISQILPTKVRARIRWYLLGDRSNFKEHCRRSIQGSSLVFIGGGQLIKNNVALFCDRLLLLGRLGKNLKVPVTLVGVGVDRKMSRLTWHLVGGLLRRCQFIILRDELSRQRVYQNVKSAADCLVLPDLVFALKNPAPKCMSAARRIAIGINVMSFKTMLSDAGTAPKIDAASMIASYCDLIERAEEDGLVVNLFTSGSAEDLVEAQRVRLESFARTNAEVPVFHPAGLDELLIFLAEVKDVVAARMHAGILAYISGCNPVCLNWDDKVRGVWSAIEQENRVIELADFAYSMRGAELIEMLGCLRPPTGNALDDLSSATRAGVMNLVDSILVQHGTIEAPAR